MPTRIPHTCPDIDKLIKYIRSLEGEQIDKRDIHHIESSLEELRSSNSELRRWAEKTEEELETISTMSVEFEEELERTRQDLKEEQELHQACVKAYQACIENQYSHEKQDRV